MNFTFYLVSFELQKLFKMLIKIADFFPFPSQKPLSAVHLSFPCPLPLLVTFS